MRLGPVILNILCITGIASAQNWGQRLPATSPPARQWHAMAYDAAHRQVVLFAGEGFGGNLADTWVWDGNTWTQKVPATSPSGRFFHAMAYDAARGQVVLFGGSFSGGVGLSDTWVWDGTNWTRKSTANTPPDRYGHALVYDEAHSQVVLFGGALGGFATGDTWVWDGTNWTRKSPQTSPPARYFHQMAYDSVHGQVVLFGGSNGINFSDTWVWDGSNWTQKSPQTSPLARYWHGLAYDSAHTQTLLFGGFASGSGTVFTDTWAWDGTNWTQKSPATNPGVRAASSMVYDGGRGQVVLFAGGYFLYDTWLFPSNSIVATGGTPQSTPVGQPFPVALEVTVTDINGNPLAGHVVQFSGNPSLVSLPSPTAVTDGLGKAHINATATANLGSYLVTALIADGGFTTFSLTNTTPPPPPPPPPPPAQGFRIFKTHSGNFTAGQQGTYTITVSNSSGASPTSGTVTVTEIPPSGEAVVSIAGAGWNCAAWSGPPGTEAPPGPIPCQRSDPLAGGNSYPPILVTVHVAANATSPQINRAQVSGGGSPTSVTSDSTNIIGGAPPPPTRPPIFVYWTLTRQNNISVRLEFRNLGTVAVTDCILTSVVVGNTEATPLPHMLGTISPGSPVVAVLTVPGSVGNPGAASSLTMHGVCNDGTHNMAARITLP